MMRIELVSGVGSVQARKMMSEVRDILVSAIRTNFRVGGRPSTWPSKRDGSASYLQKSGKLLSTVSGTSGDYTAEVVAGGTGYGRKVHFGHRHTLFPITKGNPESGARPKASGSRAFFWYMWATTKDPKWKYMFLTRDGVIKTLARPYMVLTDDDREAIRAAVKRNVFTTTQNFT